MDDAMRVGMGISQKEFISLLFDVNPDPALTAKLHGTTSSDTVPLDLSQTIQAPIAKPEAQNHVVHTSPTTDQMQATALMLAHQQFFSLCNSMSFNPTSTFSNQLMSSTMSSPLVPFDQAQWAQFVAFMQFQQQSLVSSIPMYTTPSPISLNTLLPPPVPISTMSTSSIHMSLNNSLSPTVPTVSSSVSHQEPDENKNAKAHQTLPIHIPTTISPMGNPLPEIASSKLSTVSPPSSSVSPPDLASLSSILSLSHTLDNSATPSAQEKKEEKTSSSTTATLYPVPSLSTSIPSIHGPSHNGSREKKEKQSNTHPSVIFHPYLNRPTSRKATQTPQPRLIHLSNVAKPTEKEAKRFRLMQRMAHSLLNGTNPSEFSDYSTALIDNSNHAEESKPKKERDDWNIPAILDPFTTMILDGLTNSIILKTRQIDVQFHIRMAKAIEDVPDFGLENPTLVRILDLDIDKLSGVEVAIGKFYNQYSLFGYPNFAYLIRGGLNDVDAPLCLMGMKAPMLNNSEKEFNILRKIVLWQSVILYKRGIVVDTSILTDVPTRGVLRRTIEKRIIELKKFYIYYGSTLSIVLRNAKKHEEFVMCGFLPKTIVDMEEIENSI